MAAVLQCPRTLAVHFPSEIYRSTGSSQVLPELVKSLDLPNVCAVQFMPNGVVRVTYKEPAQCDAALASGINFRGAPLRVAPVDSRTRLVYVRDLPVEVPDDGHKVFLRAFGVVHSCVRQTYPRLPQVATGTRVVKVTLAKDLPSSARISGFDVRFWYQGQPQACPVCRSYGHRVKDCPFNGLCRRCSQPGHMARECSFRRSSVSTAAASSVPNRSAPPAVPSDESSVDLRDNELSPASDPVDPAPGTPESASAAVASVPDPDPVTASAVPDPVADPVPGTPVSASDVPVLPPAKESSGSKPKKKKPRPSPAAPASASAESTPVQS
ncbi:unnamed protein product, partial [Porites evermanni]